MPAGEVLSSGDSEAEEHDQQDFRRQVHTQDGEVLPAVGPRIGVVRGREIDQCLQKQATFKLVSGWG